MSAKGDDFFREVAILGRSVIDRKEETKQLAVCESLVAELSDEELEEGFDSMKSLSEATMRLPRDAPTKALEALLVAGSKRGVFFFKGPDNYWLASFLARKPELLAQTLAAPEAWDALASDDFSEFEPADDGPVHKRFDALRGLLAYLPSLEETKELKAKRGPRWSENREWRFNLLSLDHAGAQTLAKAMDSAERSGLWEHLNKTGRGMALAMSCAIAGNTRRLKNAIEAGTRFDNAPTDVLAEFFRRFISLRFARVQDEFPQGSLSASQKFKAERLYLTEREAIWSLLVGAGMPKIIDPIGAPSVKEGHDVVSLFDHAYGLRSVITTEALRGGALNGGFVYYWALLDQERAVDPRWNGRSALAWAFDQGMDPKLWTFDTVNALMGRHDTVGERFDSPLRALAQAGVKLGKRSKPIPKGMYGESNPSMVANMLRLGVGAAGLMDAVKINVDIFERSSEGESPLEWLFSLNRVGRYAERAAGLLDAAEAAVVGGRKKMLAMRGKDGSGPMHWAARALCAQSVELFSSLGLDPMAGDDLGRSAGHWAARKYGEKNIPKVGPTLSALTKAGMDWGALDKKGVTAMAALSAKGPLEPLAELLNAAPENLFKKAGKGKSALQILTERADPEALVVAELAALNDPAVSAPAAAKASKRSRL